MEVHCDNEFGALRAVAVASPAAFRPTSPINARQAREYPQAAIDVMRLVEEHRAVVAALRSHGTAVVEIPPHPDLPYLLNVRDACVVVGQSLVACRMGRRVRAPEPYWVAAQIGPPSDSQLRTVVRGRIEGGDVFQLGPHAVVGLGSRTSAAGVSALLKATCLETADTIELAPGVLHLDTAFNAIGRTALVARSLCRSPEQVWAALRRLDVDDVVELTAEQAERFGTNFLALGERAVLASASCPEVTAALEARGIEVHAVAMDEHERIGGSVRCMTLPLVRATHRPAASRGDG